MRSPLKTVHDTNVVRRIPLQPDPESHWLYNVWEQRLVIPIANRATISELTDHVEKSAGNPNKTEAIRRDHITLDLYLRFITELNPYQPFPDAPRCADPDDQKFIELA